MAAFQRFPRDLANSFLREVDRQGTSAGTFIDLLAKGNLGSIARVSDTLLTSLDIAVQRFREAPSDYTACNNLALALRAVSRFGCAWQPSELQERAYDALRGAHEAALEANVSTLSRGARSALTHLAPFFDTEKLEEIVARHGKELSPGVEPSISDTFEGLTLASPQQLLLREGVFGALEGTGATLELAADVLVRLKNELSSPSYKDGLKVGDLLIWSKDAVQALCMLVPELARSKAGYNTVEIDEALREAVDALSWIVMASNQIDAISEGRILMGEPLQRQIAWSHQLLELRDVSWLALGLITRPTGPWASEYSSERNHLQARAFARIQNDHERQFLSAGRLPMELFLCMSGCPEGRADFDIEDVPRKVLYILGEFEAHRPCPPHRADGVGAALAGWDENLPAAGDEIVYREQLRDLAGQALRGRAFQLDAQALLIRAVHDVR